MNYSRAENKILLPYLSLLAGAGVAGRVDSRAWTVYANLHPINSPQHWRKHLLRVLKRLADVSALFDIERARGHEQAGACLGDDLNYPNV